MYAVIRTGGKQHRVSVGDVVRVERLDAETGAAIIFDEVLSVGEGESLKVGAPTVSGAAVRGTVVEQGRGEKLLIFRYRRRQNASRRRGGHRQSYTAVKIDAIEA
ncbi:MAG TPA: 50S ribosomal protein L21 [Candidatus Polarisedimenticolaceae bacterium]|nr:50S ribosomal protein L21 [Candidatus Polarisedimenticolaceae bacterium]